MIPDSPLPPPLPTPPRYRLTPVSALFYLLAVALLLFLRRGRLDAPNAAFETGVLVGAAFTLFLLPLLVSWGLWRVTGRQRWVGTLAFCAVVALGCLGQIQQAGDRARTNAVFNQVETLARKSLAETKQAVEKGDSLQGASGRIDRYQKQLAQASSNLSGNEQKIFQAGQVMLERMKVPMQVYEGFFADFNAAGGISPKSLTSPEIIAGRRRMLESCMNANLRLTTVIQDLEPAFRAELQQRGVPGPVIDSTTSGYLQSAQPALLLKIREDDRQLLESADGVLSMLANAWGHWRTNPEGRVVFQRQDDLARYNAFQQTLTSAAADEKATQQRFIESSAANQAKLTPP